MSRDKKAASAPLATDMELWAKLAEFLKELDHLGHHADVKRGELVRAIEQRTGK